MGLPALGVGAPRVGALGAGGSKGATGASVASGQSAYRPQGLLLVALVGADEGAQAERPMCHLYSMYLAILSAPKVAQESHLKRN